MNPNPQITPITQTPEFWEVECHNHCDWRGMEEDLVDQGRPDGPCCPKCGSNSFILDRAEEYDDLEVEPVVAGGPPEPEDLEDEEDDDA